MIFNKPKLTFTQMAQWIDANCYTTDRDDNTLVEYLYHLFFIKAEKCGLFTCYENYEDFALFCVSKFLIRISNKTDAPVKSVVNYMKAVLLPWHAEYVKDFCYGSADIAIADFNVNDFSDYLIDITSENDYNTYDVYTMKLGTVVRAYLSRIPIRKHSPEWSNICTSCLLTIQDRLNCASSLSKKSVMSKDAVFLNRIVRGLKTKPPILFHLPESYATYISVLVNEITHVISTELTRFTHSYVSPSTCLQNLVKAANNDEDD